jgi:hypothetical protein
MASRQLVFSSMWVNVMPTWQFKETTLLMAIFTVVIANGRLMHDDLFTVNYSNRRPRAALCVCSVRTRYNFLMWLSRDIVQWLEQMCPMNSSTLDNV